MVLRAVVFPTMCNKKEKVSVTDFLPLGQYAKVAQDCMKQMLDRFSLLFSYEKLDEMLHKFILSLTVVFRR